MPAKPELMLCTLVQQPFDKANWIFEPKLDGLRVLCIFDGRDWRLVSRNGKLQNAFFPEIVQGLARSVRKRVILDGEIVSLDEHGRSSFRLLQQRFHVTNAAVVQFRMKRFPAVVYLFDVLYHDRSDVRGLELGERKKLLKKAIRWNDVVRWTDATKEKGIAFFEETCREGGEGIVAKDLSSRYTGGRTGAWLKIKCSGRQEFVIGGFTDPQGSRVGFGALLIGYYDEDGATLRYAGKVGTGFDDKLLADLRKRMDRLEIKHSPFVDDEEVPHGTKVHFVKPQLVAEIAFSEWTQNGLLRHPRFEGLREDKKPTSVRRERAKPLRPSR
jgi:bifunctional non-homologous end joining protein LigD